VTQTISISQLVINAYLRVCEGARLAVYAHLTGAICVTSIIWFLQIIFLMR